MKRLILIALTLVLLVPAAARAEDKPPVSNIVLLGHIDFVGRYSEEDKDNDWPGYETYNLEHAVIGVAGRLGANVDWAIVQAFAFTGPFGPFNSALNADSTGPWANNDSDGMLLDARIDWHLSENVTVTAGRFIPPTSMTWAPHLMRVMHTINYPLINGGGLSGAMLPLPMYQTGVMLTAAGAGMVLQVGNFNGSETIGGSDSPLTVLGMNNTMDIDKTKGTAAKVSLTAEGFHVGGWYFGEEAAVSLAGSNADGKMDQWGVELAYDSEGFLLQGQYLSSTFDARDSAVKDNLVQSGWYGLIGMQSQGTQIIYRFDQVYHDGEDILPDDVPNDEQAETVGFNWLVNPNFTVGLNYTWRKIDGIDANTNEVGLIMETNLF